MMSLFEAQHFYDEICQAAIAFFDLNGKEALPIVSDLLGCLEEEAGVLAKNADQPASTQFLVAFDNIATVAQKLQTNELLGMLNRLAKCSLPAHAEERKRVIDEMLKRLAAARTLHPL